MMRKKMEEKIHKIYSLDNTISVLTQIYKNIEVVLIRYKWLTVIHLKIL